MKVVQLAEGLKIAAMGGSSEIHREEKGALEEIWPHAKYPFLNDDQYTESLNKLWIEATSDGSGDQIVLMAHDGPKFS